MGTCAAYSRRAALLGLAAAFTCSSAAWAAESAKRPALEYLAQTAFPTGYKFAETEAGGLSGLDYDAASGIFISETDHSQPGHYYTLKPVFTPGQPGYGLTFTGLQTLGPGDAESIRFDPKGDGVWFTIEGWKPGIFHQKADGQLVSIAPPHNIATRAQYNYGLEGATFTSGGTLVVSLEDSLSGDATDVTRIAVVRPDGTPGPQYAYRLDTLPGITNAPSLLDRTNNGVSDILAVSDTVFLVMERAWDGVKETTPPTGVSHNSIRIYRVDTTDATDVGAITNLPADAPALAKTPVFDSASLAGPLGTYETKVDNLEGMTFGPRLPDGRASLVLVNDNNYSRSQGKTQFLVFAINDPALVPTATARPASSAVGMMKETR